MTSQRKLHIGGIEESTDWEILDITARDNVDHTGNASDLSQFDDNTFSEIYASHVIEHFGYRGHIQAALGEWNRVLIPGGTLYISAPDLDILCQLFLMKNQLTFDERFYVMQMMFGGQGDEHDFHFIGLNYEFLGGYLQNAGFINIRRVSSFGKFADTSEQHFKDTPISVNMIAEKLPTLVDAAE